MIYMEKELNEKELINFRLNKELKSKFINYCKINGYSQTKRLTILIENDINGKLTINN